MGRRIAKTIEGQTTYFLYTDEGLIAELNQQGKLTKAYGWVADTSYSTSPLWQAEPQAGETTISDLKQAQFHTLTTDHLGTVQMATNEAGEVTWKAQSQAFGQTTLDEQNQITMNLRFPGQYFDEETGTHYNYFRDYQPTTGRYIQRDPIGLEGGINTYAYVNSNSLKYDDPFGEALQIPIIIIIVKCAEYAIPVAAAYGLYNMQRQPFYVRVVGTCEDTPEGCPIMESRKSDKEASTKRPTWSDNYLPSMPPDKDNNKYKKWAKDALKQHYGATDPRAYNYDSQSEYSWLVKFCERHR